ncbi:aspartate/glutamate racemase family protein [Paraglaciecola chathamensis]|uniref:Aspartate racemase n=1 Tax=Paraglaciecola chathamensis TaxID=368405 RepID=A0A8H9M1V6_9ALTE|nr:aspartate/glutamate racemase family protein [Paraglaciecola oceanifecundans]GGZ71059.1 aspartate racemase [Paraglaciecola oceanifecundans]
MKTIGMLGGMSWESTAQYYRLINQEVNHRLKGLHSASLILRSVDFENIAFLQQKGDWKEAGKILSEEAINLEKAGADFLIICTNTMHKVAPEITASISVPVLHIADTTAEVLQQENISRVGLLGTAFTMEQSFYTSRLTNKFGIEVITPNADDRAVVHNIIYQELCKGKIKDESRKKYLNIISALAADGCQGVILGCTEISLLVKQIDTDVPLFDTTELHALAAVNSALS